MRSIFGNRSPIDAPQAEQLRATFASPGYSVLREVIAAHCVEAQAAFLDAALYATQAAETASDVAKGTAQRFNSALDVLDDVQAKEEEWFRITLEQRR